MLFCLFMLALPNDTEWSFEETGVFQPLSAEEVRVSLHGIYILNFKDAVIHRVGLDGNLLGHIGSKGKGPGEFTFPTDIFVDETGLYVLDVLTSSISQFKHDGVFVKRVNLPNRNVVVKRVKDGWLYGTWRDEQNIETAGLYLANDEFESIRKIVQVTDVGVSSGMQIEMDNDGAKAMFGPISTTPILVVSQDGQTAYLSEGQNLTIHVVDVIAGKVTHTITRPERPVPFDVDWADERFESIQERLPKRDRNIKFVKAYPDFFPVVRELMLTPENELVVNRWAGKPDDHDHAIAMDRKGNNAQIKWAWSQLERVAGVQDGFAYVTTFDADNDEAGVVKVKQSEAIKFIDRNAIVFDGEAGRSIMISD